jgi:hypothetical protein
MQINCNGYKLFTGYRLTGIKAAGALHRVLYGTWESFPVDVPRALQESKETVQQKFYSSHCNSIPMKSGDATGSCVRSHSSDEVFVMKMERRASVYPCHIILKQLLL